MPLEIDSYVVDVTINAEAFNEAIDSPNGFPDGLNREIEIQSITYKRNLYSEEVLSMIDSQLLCNSNARERIFDRLREADANSE